MSNKFECQLSKLIKEAKVNGYEFINGEFIKIVQEEVNVIYISTNSLGCGENFLNFEIFDKLYILTDKQLEKVKEVRNKEDLLNLIGDFTFDDDYCSVRCLENIDESHIFYMQTFDKIDIKEYIYETYLVARFHNEDYDEAGFIEVFKCPKNVFEKHKNIYEQTNSYIME